MNDLQWDYILGSDLYPHVEDELRIGRQEVMNPRPLLREELFCGMPVFWRYVSHQGYGFVAYVPAFVLATNRKRIGIAVIAPDVATDKSWQPKWVTLASLRHREERA